MSDGIHVRLEILDKMVHQSARIISVDEGAMGQDLPPGDWVSVSAATKEAGPHRTTVIAATKRGDITGVFARGRWYADPNSLVDWLLLEYRYRTAPVDSHHGRWHRREDEADIIHKHDNLTAATLLRTTVAAVKTRRSRLQNPPK